MYTSCGVILVIKCLVYLKKHHAILIAIILMIRMSCVLSECIARLYYSDGQYTDSAEYERGRIRRECRDTRPVVNAYYVLHDDLPGDNGGRVYCTKVALDPVMQDMRSDCYNVRPTGKY